jgi:hypothetical protein
VIGFTWWHNVILIVIAYSVVTWFVDIDADAAEGISTSFLAENYQAQGFENMQNAIPVKYLLFSISRTNFYSEAIVITPLTMDIVEK